MVVVSTVFAVTNPDEVIDATAADLLAQTPPVGNADNNDVCPTQADKLPAIPPGTGLTVTICETEQPNLV